MVAPGETSGKKFKQLGQIDKVQLEVGSTPEVTPASPSPLTQNKFTREGQPYKTSLNTKRETLIQLRAAKEMKKRLPKGVAHKGVMGAFENFTASVAT